MTGRYAANVGLSLALVPGNPAGLEPTYPTLAEHLAARGYTSHLVGKWHLGQSKEQYHPLRRGFHSFYGLLGGGLDHWTKQQGRGRLDWWRDWLPEFENVTHSTDMLNREALRVVKEASSPYFLYLSYPAVHDPLLAPERHQRLCDHVPNYRRRLSCAMVAGIEEGVGALVAELDAQGTLEDTIIAFSIDNGGVPYAGALNYPLRGAKSTLYEGGVRSPGFIHAPKFLPSQDFAPLFHVADYLPTLLSLVTEVEKAEGEEGEGVKGAKATTTTSTIPGVRLDGVDQVGAMVGREAAVRTSLHIHRDYGGDGHAYRRGPWKVIVGHHCLPFFYTKVYNESHSRWIDESGGVRAKALQLIQEAIDLVMGPNWTTTGLNYILWIVFDSFNVGGLSEVRRTAGGGSDRQAGSILVPTYPTDLDHYLHLQQEHPNYPLVSLFNLEEDPSEATNLASRHPALVRQLLAEAEALLWDAPMQVKGTMTDANAPVGPEEQAWGGWWALLLTLGSHHASVVPNGPYLADDFDYTKLQYMTVFSQVSWNIIIVLTKVGLVCLILPILLLYLLLRLFS